VGLKPIREKKKNTSDLPALEISNNNMIFDGPSIFNEAVPVHYVNHIDQIYPVGSICQIALKRLK
jgi:hypothetical protein